ncbi:MAG: hypothetical protein FJX76_07615 [Armatimonadetes bacterium]|nr:hypothetical protein [Armatimonadota bacterium]
MNDHAMLYKLIMPAQHGGWGFLLEPMLLGLILAPTAPGALLAVAAFLVFLTHHPLSVVMGDFRKGEWSPRGTLPLQICVLFLAAAWAAFSVAAMSAWQLFWPALTVGVPCALVFLYEDASRHIRSLPGELGGALGMAALAPVIMLCGGWSLTVSFAVWALLVARSVIAILYVRMQVRRMHRKPFRVGPVVSAHVGALAAVAVGWGLGMVPLTAVAAFCAMLFVVMRGVRVPPESAKALGWSEMRLGIATVALVAVGYLCA